jgi:gp16 family phage-associated protein
MMEQKPLKTRQQVLEDFARKGQSVRGWAKAHGVSHGAVTGLLSGRLSGRIGESHKAAVLLGLKHGEIVRLDNGREYDAKVITAGDVRIRKECGNHD